MQNIKIAVTGGIGSGKSTVAEFLRSKGLPVFSCDEIYHKLIKQKDYLAAMNMPLQGSSADIIKIAMINVYKKLNECNLRARLVLQVHDELVIDCPEEEKDIVSGILKTEMENAVALKVPLTVEVGCGKNWFAAK